MNSVNGNHRDVRRECSCKIDVKYSTMALLLYLKCK